MTKDFEILASLIREARTHYDAGPLNGNMRIGVAIEALEFVATEFADTAPGVDRVAFLALCGIDTDVPFIKRDWVCKECAGSGMVDTGIGSMVCTGCVTFTLPR